MDLDDVCTAIAQAITSAALDVGGNRVTATPFAPEALTAPHFYTAEFTGNYNQTYGALMDLTLTCRLMVSRSDDKAGQQGAKALASTGAGTLSAAFLDMRGAPGQAALGGEADDIHLLRVQGPRLYEIGQASYYGLEFTVFVMG